ncbi:MAG: class I SAM-dependent methyltransferase family protein [Thermoplasmata archaeon]|nr:class I SAM-dependent methyltransferase family protein [Thermoplasmata archaeon]
MATRKTKAVCAPLTEAEPIRRALRERNLLRDDVEIAKEGKYIYFPVKDVPEELCSYKVVTKSFELKAAKPHSYKDRLKLSKKLMEELPTSYDVVGAIILIKLPKTLFSYRKEIGKALLETHKNIRTVCLIDPVSGELRTRNVSIIAGENQTLTTHTEYGLSFHVDVETTYFSPRLASERKRVADLVQPGEIVVDMFAGVAPFSIMIARYAKPRIVYAIDKNKEAAILAQQNVKQNHVLDTVEIIHADANDVEKVVPKKADRIIMNLPFSAYRFFSLALSIAAKTCIVHYYDIIKEEDIEARIDALKKIAAEHNYILTDLSIRKIKSYAPREFYIGIDITATKHADVA